jgi:hypothetical protein
MRCEDFEIFDKASRGSWGAVMLLFRTKGRSLAALGALLIVLLLAIDTVFQQVVEISDRWALQDTVSAIPRTIWYQSGEGKEYRAGYPVATNNADFFHVLGKFSYGNGIQPVPFGNGTRPEIPLECQKSLFPFYR